MSETNMWRIVLMSGYTINHPHMAVAPGCPAKPHPTRWCACKVHRNKATAQKYVDEQKKVAA